MSETAPGEPRILGGMNCPDLETIADLCEGRLLDAQCAQVEAHLADCAECRAAAAGWAAWEDATEAARPPAPRRARLAVAAALLIGVGAAISLLSQGKGGVVPLRDGLWSDATGSSRTFRVGERIPAPQGGVLALADGTRVEAGAGADLAVQEPAAGERLRIRLDAGESLFRVARAAGEVRVESPLGGVVVHGTTFRMRLFQDPFGTDAGPFLEVALEEGQVSVRGGSGRVDLEPRQYAYVLSPGAAPQRDYAVPATAYWAGEVLARLDAARVRGDAVQAAFHAALLRRLGEAGVAAAAARVRTAGEAGARRRAVEALGVVHRWGVPSARAALLRLRGAVADDADLQAAVDAALAGS